MFQKYCDIIKKIEDIAKYYRLIQIANCFRKNEFARK